MGSHSAPKPAQGLRADFLFKRGIGDSYIRQESQEVLPIPALARGLLSRFLPSPRLLPLVRVEQRLPQPDALRRDLDHLVVVDVGDRLFERYGPYKGTIDGRQTGVLISNAGGQAVAYALNALEDRGALMVSPGEPVYEGMIVGENAKPEDLEVNPLKSKQLTNFRASGPKDEAIRLTPPKRLTLEQAIAYIDDDELVEVTPKSIRLRKRYLDPHERKRANRAKAA